MFDSFYPYFVIFLTDHIFDFFISIFTIFLQKVYQPLQTFFQEDRIESMRILGACLVFGFGVVYEIIDTVISFKMCPAYNGTCITRVRLSIAVISFISVIICILTRIRQDSVKVPSYKNMTGLYSRRKMELTLVLIIILSIYFYQMTL